MAAPQGRKERAKCPWCGKIIAVSIARGGTDNVFPRHTAPAGSARLRCDGSRMLVERKDYRPND